jgi:cell division protein FtsI/penicillin-binding protein 2
MRKRAICFCIVLLFLFSSIIGRVGYIGASKNFLVSSSYNSYSVNIETHFPTLYYSNGEKINNNSQGFVAVLKPNERTLADLHNLFSSNEAYKISQELKKGYPIIQLISPENRNKANYIEVYDITTSDYMSPQLFSSYSSGLMKYAKPYGNRKIRFHTDALGRMLRGDNGEIYEEYESSLRGLNLTIDKDVENISISASRNMKSGCVVIMNTADSSILACITKPKESYLNKPCMQYSVGSVFKIIVCACALENEVDFYYNCSGKTTVGDTTFSCQNSHSHGFENLKLALANSCNCYFVNLALKLGSDKLLQTAEALGFNDEIKLYDNWSFKAASLPTKTDLLSKGELALFGFGQGKFSASPIQICSSLCTIANKGNKNDIHFVLSGIDENINTEKFEYENSKKVLSDETCNTLLNYLRYVVTDGTGKNAESSSHKSAGKTATAQTGQYNSGVERLNTWFAGVYPYDNPKYAIVVMTENGKSGSEDCAPIYREIVEKLKKL